MKVISLIRKVFREMKKLESWFNPQATKEIDDHNRGRYIWLEQVNLALCTTAMIKKTKNYEKSLNCDKKENQIAWKEVIDKELEEVTKRGVWKIIDEKDISSDRRCIKNKWILKIKRNGVFRARVVAYGYSQVPGVDFS
jgi:hypothetical protein